MRGGPHHNAAYGFAFPKYDSDQNNICDGKGKGETMQSCSDISEMRIEEIKEKRETFVFYVLIMKAK